MTLPDSNSQEGGKAFPELREALKRWDDATTGREEDRAWELLKSACSPDTVRAVLAAYDAAVSPTPSQEGRSSLSVEGWQPIETAPKDGRGMLLASGNWITTGAWHPNRFWCCKGLSYAAYPADEQPTHWMPLPNPPEQA